MKQALIGVAGVPLAAESGTTRERNEWILKQSTSYLVRVTAIGDNTSVGVALGWYEQED